MLRLAGVVAIILCLGVILWVYNDERTVGRGQAAFMRYGCPSCHYSGGAPNLQNVTKKYDREMLVRFISDPDSIYRERGNQPLNAGFRPMPKIRTQPEEVKDITAYLRSLAD